MSQWSETDIAYLAGIVEFGGQITIKKYKDSRSKNILYSSVFIINSSNTDFIKRLVSSFGGQLITRKTYGYKSSKLRWNCPSHLHHELFSLIHPLTFNRKSVVELLIKFLEIKKHAGKRSSNPIDDIKKEEIYQELIHTENRLCHIGARSGKIV